MTLTRRDLVGGLAVAAFARAPDRGANGRPMRVNVVTDISSHLRTASEDEISWIEKMNRADRKHLLRLDRVVIPAESTLSPIAWSTLPVLHTPFQFEPKLVAVHIPSQQFGAYSGGVLTYCSGSAGHETPQGSYRLNWKSEGHRSTVNPEWYLSWYWNLDERRGVAMHSSELPGYPASHACIRMLERDAKWLFEWGEKGTPVLVTGKYDFGKSAPWLNSAFWNQEVDLSGVAQQPDLRSPVPEAE